MTADELCQRLEISRRTLKHLITIGALPKAHGRTRRARYGLEHVEAYQAYRALQHHAMVLREVLELCQRSGIDLPTYVQSREAAIRQFGMGVG